MKAVLHIAKKWWALSALFSFIVIGFSDCNSARQVAYFQDVPDSLNVEKRVRNTAFVEPVIHKGDILHIEVTTIDAQMGSITKQEQTISTEKTDGGSPEISGYMVDKSGFVEVPIIGKLNVEGKTTDEVKELVRARAKKYYKEPMVNVRISNFYITVLGEVKMPGRYVINTEKVNIIDAIGLAGDLAIGGKRANVMIIREEHGETVFSRIDMNSTDVFKSKYFYLQPGDKIYVEPLRAIAKSGTSDQRVDRWVSLSLGLVSMSVAVVSVILRYSK